MNREDLRAWFYQGFWSTPPYELFFSPHELPVPYEVPNSCPTYEFLDLPPSLESATDSGSSSLESVYDANSESKGTWRPFLTYPYHGRERSEITECIGL